MLLFVSLGSFIVSAQDETPAPQVELFVYNNYGSHLYIRFYPITSVFSGRPYQNTVPQFSLESALISGVVRLQGGDPLNYLVGLDGYALTHRGPEPGFFQLLAGNFLSLDHNTSGSGLGADGLFGYGLYRLEIYGADTLLLAPPITIDCKDINYPYINPTQMKIDLHVYIEFWQSTADVKFNWQEGTDSETDIMSVWDTRMDIEDRGVLRFWKQYGMPSKKWTKN